MFNKIYRLKHPRQFEIVFKDININNNQVIVRPTHLSICNADQRYYKGIRSDEIMRQKLPMALIHEGIGKVLYDPTKTFNIGSEVVMIPNIPSETDDIISENYLSSSRFMSSNTDGYLQEYIQSDANQFALLPENINQSVAAFTEIISVSYHAIDRFIRFTHNRRNIIGIWGDGNLGYITSLLLKIMYPEIKVFVFGINRDKLCNFTFADATYHLENIPQKLSIDHAFECVGGNTAYKAINQIINHINPEGTISILGVSEDFVLINTRTILEKGLRMFGTSRSTRKDFLKVMELYKNKPELVLYLENIVGAEIRIRGIKDITAAFETDINKLTGKTIMIWDE